MESVIATIRIKDERWSIKRVERCRGFCYMIYKGRNVYDGYQFTTYQRALMSLFYDIQRRL